MAYTTVITHATGDVLPATDWNTYLRDDLAFLHDQGADLASAATLVGITTQFHRVTGTTTITAITAPAGTGQGGNLLRLKFQSAGCAITAGAALVLTGGPFLSVANGVILFVWDATAAAWVEVERMNGNPGLELDYAQITAPVSVTAITEATANAIVTGNSVTYDGSRVKVELFTPESFGGNITHVLLRDATILGYPDKSVDTAQDGAVLTNTFDTPPAGAHQYAWKAYTNTGTKTVGAGAGGTGALLPAFLRVTRA